MKQHRTLNLILNCIIGILIVAFLAGSLYRYWDYQARPDFYAAPISTRRCPRPGISASSFPESPPRLPSLSALC